MIERLHITILVENTVTGRGLIAEHGLSLWVEADEHRILFDTGQGYALGHNASALGIDLRQARQVVLSHGHYDHTGGLVTLPDTFRDATLYIHPAARTTRYSWKGDRPAAAGMDRTLVAELEARVGKVVETYDPTSIVPGIRVTGTIPRNTPFENTGGKFSFDTAGQEVDSVQDDQALVIDMPRGVVVLLGCAHAGLINTLQAVREMCQDRPIDAVIGGTHLLNAAPDRIDTTIETLKSLSPRVLAPLHCTGLEPTVQLRGAFPDAFRQLTVGSRVELP